MMNALYVILGALLTWISTSIIEHRKEKIRIKENYAKGLLLIIREINILIKEVATVEYKYRIAPTTDSCFENDLQREEIRQVYDTHCIDIISFLDLYIEDKELSQKLQNLVNQANKDTKITFLSQAKQEIRVHYKSKKLPPVAIV